MKNWKAYIAGLFVLCLCLMTPFASVFAEENEESQETEEPIPDSYYYEMLSELVGEEIKKKRKKRKKTKKGVDKGQRK